MEPTKGRDATFANESLPTVYGVVVDFEEYLRAQSVYNILLCQGVKCQAILAIHPSVAD
jgi:hypothetical protein